MDDPRYSWMCTYYIGNREIPSIVIATCMNEALTKLDKILPKDIQRVHVERLREVRG